MSELCLTDVISAFPFPPGSIWMSSDPWTATSEESGSLLKIDVNLNLDKEFPNKTSFEHTCTHTSSTLQYKRSDCSWTKEWFILICCNNYILFSPVFLCYYM